jgi:hypothetical protein
MDSAHTVAIHRFFLRLSLATSGLFAWILIFHALYAAGETEQGALLLTAASFAFLQMLIFFLTPLAGMNTKHGTSRSMILSSLALAAGFLWLASASMGIFGGDSLNVLWGIIGFVFFSAVYRAFYWVPYSAIGISSRSAWSASTRFLLEILLSLSPAAAAVIISQTENGSWFILVGAAITAFLSALVLIPVHDSYERFEMTYVETIASLFRSDNRHLLSLSIFEGVQGAGLLFIWPLSIFMLFSWSYLKLGLMLSITLLIALLLRRRVQKSLRGWSLHDNKRFLAAVLRLTVVSPITVVLADSMSHSSLPLRRIGLDPIAGEQAADSSHYIDEYTALKEMGMALGRILLCLILVFALFYSSAIVALGVTLVIVGAVSIIHHYRSESEAL